MLVGEDLVEEKILAVRLWKRVVTVQERKGGKVGGDRTVGREPSRSSCRHAARVLLSHQTSQRRERRGRTRKGRTGRVRRRGEAGSEEDRDSVRLKEVPLQA
jgi:hypothetical protein